MVKIRRELDQKMKEEETARRNEQLKMLEETQAKMANHLRKIMYSQMSMGSSVRSPIFNLSSCKISSKSPESPVKRFLDDSKEKLTTSMEELNVQESNDSNVKDRRAAT